MRIVHSWFVIVCIFAAILSVYEALSAPPPTDFLQDYLAASNLWHGRSIYYNDDQSIAQNKHPPVVAVLVTPLTSLAAYPAFITFTLLSALAYLMLLRLCLKESLLTPELSSFALAYALVWNPLYSTLVHGQLSAILALLMIQGWTFVRNKKQKLGGLLLGLAALIKIFPLFPLCIFYPLGYKRAFWCGIATFTAGVIISLILAGQSDLHAFFWQIANANFKEYRTHPLNASFAGLIFPLFTAESYVHPLIESPITAWIILTSLSTAAICLCAHFAYRARRLSPQVQSIAYSLSLVVMTLISPLSWSHGFIVLLPTLLILLRTTMNSSPLSTRIIFLSITIAFALPDVVFSNMFKQQIQAGLDWWVFISLKYNSIALAILSVLLYKYRLLLRK